MTKIDKLKLSKSLFIFSGLNTLKMKGGKNDNKEIYSRSDVEMLSGTSACPPPFASDTDDE